jgi:hypothetical protein
VNATKQSAFLFSGGKLLQKADFTLVDIVWYINGRETKVECWQVSKQRLFKNVVTPRYIGGGYLA